MNENIYFKRQEKLKNVLSENKLDGLFITSTQITNTALVIFTGHQKSNFSLIYGTLSDGGH